MDAGKVAEVLDRVLEDNRHHDDCAKSFHLPPFGQPCTCGWAEVERDAIALVAELRAEAARRNAPCACDPALMQACSSPTCGGWAPTERTPSVASDNDPQAALQRAALPVHTAVEGAPKVRATFGKVAGFCVVPGCAAEAIRPSLRYCEAHNDLTGRSA